jgi:repressor LexA
MLKAAMKPTEFKEIRKHLGLTQDELAALLDVHRLSVIRWEAGVHRIPMILKLALTALVATDCRTP